MPDQNIIFIDENIPLLAESLSPCGKIIRFSGRELKTQDLIDSKCNYLFIRSTTKINGEFLNGTKVEFLGTATSGIDHVDSKYLFDNKIQFVSAPGANANSVAEYVLYSILLYARQEKINILGKSIGIVGFGNVGKIVAQYAKNMGLQVMVNDPPLVDEGFTFPDYVKYTSLDKICENCDIITNHVPLTTKEESPHPTHNLFNSKNIAKIKNKALFIHASRGWVVDEKPLLVRLKNKSLIGSIDVFENEPLVDSAIVQSAILSTPHIAGYSRDGKLRGGLMMIKAFEKYSHCQPDMSAFTELDTYSPLPETDFLNYDKVFSLLHKNRKLDEDHKRFVETMHLSDIEKTEAFDRLRKKYPKRRESL